MSGAGIVLMVVMMVVMCGGAIVGSVLAARRVRTHHAHVPPTE